MEWLFMGLGNNGPGYSETRHNAGFLAIDALAELAGAGRGQTKGYGRFAGARIGGSEVGLFKPAGFMNVCGEALVRCLASHPVEVDRLVVFHDDMDLELGRVQVKIGGGDGGHRGLRSITDVLGGGFVRVRMGVGRPPEGMDAAEYVLERFAPEERAAVDSMVMAARDTGRTIAGAGLTRAMNAVNRRRNPCSAPDAGPKRPEGGQ